MSKRTETPPMHKTKPPKKLSKSNLSKPKSSKTAPSSPTIKVLRQWFESKGWEAKSFQEEAWLAYLAGKSGMIHVPTGAGKTYAAYLAALVEIIQTQATGLQILYITPLRALSRDIELALTHPAQELLEILEKTSEPKKPIPAFKVSVESRTGDTNASTRARQKRKMPQVLITTPESLSVMLSGGEAATTFSTLKLVIVDEWHELLSTKRGTLLELSLSRLRMFAPDLITWALSATLVNLEEAAQAAVGMEVSPVLIQNNSPREIVLETLLPQDINTFPWSGHLGLAMLEPLLQKLEEGLEKESSMLLFTNTRAQAERWFFALSEARPQWSSILALHHGSLEREVREQVEGGLKSGELKIVVCTSTLDLGVDFSPVDWVFQIGSPKGIARMIQRAGRSGHRPGATCHIICVPTHAFELVEIAATRKAMAERLIEARHPFQNPLDVLSQHLITCALGGGLNPETMYQAVQKTYSYQTLSKEAFEWVMQFIRQGGECLKAYPDYHKIHLTDAGLYEVTENHIARLHRMNIGTITSSASIQICFLKGNALGFVEESFISKLKKGDRFGFSGRVLEFVQLRESKAYVKLAKGKPTSIPSWQGGRLPLSTTLSASVREILDVSVNLNLKAPPPNSVEISPELACVLPVLRIQGQVSGVPKASELLVESCKTREGTHLFLYPFEGRLVHEGLSALLAYRFTQYQKGTFAITVNDYGIEILSGEAFPFLEILEDHRLKLLSTDDIFHDIAASMNMSELAKRQFRDIARIAGLVVQNYPGTYKTTRQLQTSSAVIFDVFQKYDPKNLLLSQAQEEVLSQQFEQERLRQALIRLSESKLLLKTPEKPTPFGFPLVIDRLGIHVSNESLQERIEKMKAQWLKL